MLCLPRTGCAVGTNDGFEVGNPPLPGLTFCPAPEITAFPLGITGPGSAVPMSTLGRDGGTTLGL